MVVGMDAFFSQNLICPIGEYFIGVHIMTGSGTGLERIDDKLVQPHSVQNLIGCLFDGSGIIGREQP